ncbi:alpha/beta hydrolase family protein [Thiothrix nivea]|uniref:AB hydrolase-1 domain-containing protein n=1 Tax=Thiothrix nivea (strain ATCC 35100 / DSM 5205 / JP2) TaxID=870187 RepID=A0A656HN51_THINJ|nr:alpha/beta fold hydrolase [Thiothrix nivea]EIJ36780.1 hypothetical protein Thini_4298 [Thiothrix nivea DSM 5205]
MAMADNLFQPEPFFIEFEQVYLHGDMLRPPDKVDYPPAVLFLHGADRSEDRTVFNVLRQLLLSQYGLSSCAFDFIGHGSTGGKWGCSTLQECTAQALDMVDACFDCQPFSIVGVGMGAYTALKVVPEDSVSNLVLITPALYSPEVYETTLCEVFNQDAPDAPKHWKQTDVWEVMQGFQGKVSIVTASQDQMIPPEIATRLYSQAGVARERRIVEVPGSSHALIAFANRHPAILSSLAGVIADTCSLSEAQEPRLFGGGFLVQEGQGS